MWLYTFAIYVCVVTYRVTSHFIYKYLLVYMSPEVQSP